MARGTSTDLIVSHNQKWINASYHRLHEIEQELRTMGFGTRLHTSIREMGNGTVLTILLVIVVLGAWIVRILFSLAPILPRP